MNRGENKQYYTFSWKFEDMYSFVMNWGEYNSIQNIKNLSTENTRFSDKTDVANCHISLQSC